MPSVVIANDQGAIELTQIIIKHLEERHYNVKYLGISENKSVDYPDMAELCCNEFKKGSYEFGVLCCGTGIGISICANKIEGIRCALPQNIYASKMAKEHNDANFIAFGGRIEYQDNVLDMLDAFINTKASLEERHIRRREKISSLESKIQ